jgi:hypothetical protein
LSLILCRCSNSISSNRSILARSGALVISFTLPALRLAVVSRGPCRDIVGKIRCRLQIVGGQSEWRSGFARSSAGVAGHPLGAAQAPGPE